MERIVMILWISPYVVALTILALAWNTERGAQTALASAMFLGLVAYVVDSATGDYPDADDES